jgi:hypothetical protein
MGRVMLLAFAVALIFIPTAGADPAQPFRFTQPVLTVNNCSGESLTGTAIEQGWCTSMRMATRAKSFDNRIHSS